MRPAPNPIDWFNTLFAEAKAKAPAVADAMVLATASKDGRPSARVVLFKGFSAGTGALRFFTNYESAKGRELASNPQAALVFYWEPLGCQIRVEGRIEKTSTKESDEYWASRPRESQLGGAASKQSSVLSSRAALEETLERLAREHEGKPVPRPPHWGGFRLEPESFEFWFTRPGRFHERYLYRKSGSSWKMSELSP